MHRLTIRAPFLRGFMSIDRSLGRMLLPQLTVPHLRNQPGEISSGIT
jgi:hypothetical protein